MMKNESNYEIGSIVYLMEPKRWRITPNGDWNEYEYLIGTPLKVIGNSGYRGLDLEFLENGIRMCECRFVKFSSENPIELLLKDLCGRIPYNVKGSVNGSGIYTVNAVSSNGLVSLSDYNPSGMCEIRNFRPYLFPSVPDELREEYNATYHMDIRPTSETFDWRDKHHIDYRHLIRMSLAIDATDLNIY